MERLPQCSHEKLDLLRASLRDLGSAAVAFSAGVDSTFLLRVAHETLGDHVVAVTARSRSFPAREIDEAAAFCRAEGVRHVILDPERVVDAVAILRLANPSTPLRFAGGRRDMSDETAAKCIYVGMSAGIAGHLLTTPGTDFADDRALAAKAGYEVAHPKNHDQHCTFYGTHPQ